MKKDDGFFVTTKDNILAAAKECGDAKRVLKKLYPEAFKGVKEWRNITKECSVRWIPSGTDSKDFFMRIVYRETEIGIVYPPGQSPGREGNRGLHMYNSAKHKVESSVDALSIYERVTEEVL